MRLLLLRVNYIQLQRKNNNFHGLTIKTKRILGLKLYDLYIAERYYKILSYLSTGHNNHHIKTDTSKLLSHDIVMLLKDFSLKLQQNTTYV